MVAKTTPMRDSYSLNMHTDTVERGMPKGRGVSLHQSMLRLISVLALLSFLSPSLVRASAAGTSDYLNENSVILITGAAGFLGSELALALHRTYSPKKILCIDRMGDHPSTQEDLALFEFKRQRAFHVLQTLGAKGRFYRVDFRPMIPEYFDMGEVPVLDHIFREHPGITHVVHLADPFPHSALQVIPREKDVPKAGMIEALLEQLLKIKLEGGRVPHFSYASSYEVYPFASNATTNELRETDPISTPSSLRGASKLIDEIIAKMYYDEHGLYSVALRFFPVYGPWSIPGSPLFDIAERAVEGNLPSWGSEWKSVRDYVYIDDAVDAMMAGMQFRPPMDDPTPIVFNVASGERTTLEHIANIMKEYFPPGNTDRHDVPGEGTEEDKQVTTAIGSTERANQLLGYQPQVPLKDGIVQLLAWHYDRAYPYGGHQNLNNEKVKFIASQGISSCEPSDKECLKAAPVFPCSSECSHEMQCTSSFYDEVVGRTQALTSECESVLYTVDLRSTLESLPSTHIKVHSTSKSFLPGKCNLAFVAENSKLVQSLRGSNSMLSGWNTRDKLLKHGKWILVPIPMPSFSVEESILRLLPKLSPGLFFAATTKRAIYCDPDILVDNINMLLRQASLQPRSEDEEGATAMLIGRGKPREYFPESEQEMPTRQVLESPKIVVQNAAYRMVRIAVSDELFGDGLMELLDSRWMVHTLQSDDARLFRCDVFGEVVQWDVDSDRSALEFILGLHDMWSRVIAKQPWWIGDKVESIPEDRASRRRLEEVRILPSGDRKNGEDKGENENNAGEGAEKVDENEEEAEEEVQDDDDEASDTADEEQDGGDGAKGKKVEDEDGAGFGIQGEGDQEVEAGDKNRGASSEQDDDDEESGDDADASADPLLERDFSSYDTWMGVLSASSVKYFVRIVPSSEVGVVSLDDYE